ncbi:SWIM zinc finger family protein [Parabacteroides sp.]
MDLSLDNFEQQIDGTILERGLDYFKKGYVTDVEDLGGGDYEATVEGSDTYTVHLHIKGDKVTEYDCDCPYDWGPVCKHIVAVLFYLRKDLLDMDSLTKVKTRPKEKKESETQQMEKILKQLTHDELRSFVRDMCVTDKNFRHLFVAKHISNLYPESKELYAKQLKMMVKTYAGRHGFVEYREAGQLGKEVCGIIDDELTGLGNGNKRKALYVAEAAIEEMKEALDCSDDSDGAIGGCIGAGFELLEALVESDLDEALHDELFGWLMASFEKGFLNGWDWHFNLTDIAIRMMKTEREKERIKTNLSLIRPAGDSWDWEYRQSQNLMLKLIRKTEGEKACVAFMESHLENPDIRKGLIEKALAGKEYEKAEKLAAEGVRKDEKEFPGLADDWRNYLLSLYMETNDVARMISLARYFFVTRSGRYHPQKYYYDLLKSLTSQDQWPSYVDGLVSEMSNKSRYGIDYAGISQLYVWESRWADFFKLLQENATLDRVVEAEQYLADSYPMELAAMYRDLILDYMERQMGREHYQSACRYIRRMIKLGARLMAVGLIERLRKLYPARRAMLEELAKI